MGRPRIADVAERAGVGIATVDRVLNRRAPVRDETMQKVLAAAEALGYHNSSLLRRRMEETRPQKRLGVLLQRRSEPFYQGFAGLLTQAARSQQARMRIEFCPDLAPATVSNRITDLAKGCDAIAVVAADHPRIGVTVEALATRMPVFTLLSDLSTEARTAFFGVDHHKAGRLAAWSIARLARRPGPVVVMMGSRRYLGHEETEIAFTEFFRQSAPDFEVLPPLISLEDAHMAREGVLDLLGRRPDLAGIYIACSGFSGAIAALREQAEPGRVVTVSNELTIETRAGLESGILDVVLGTPIDQIAQDLVGWMTGSCPESGSGRRNLYPVSMHVVENI
ncbi:LacI family DNA-binding transcriptional regulator [Beijerinckia mobilis]|uniref:LacI family DNA-binding transcriptional regulator n=1 Tax=Beijerinckia mobilis TaxID=231434 RepID=UPI0005594B71|nr:LacI family DNA-binding transcriptional regulator [Beijerinckia mobilis]